MKKRSTTNLRFQFQPEILIEPSIHKEEVLNDKIDSKGDNSSNINHLHIHANQYKKQKTLSEKRNKFSKKSMEKASINESVTRKSKWSQYIRSEQKGAQQSPGKAKKIERKFTMSSSISTIR